MDPKNFDNVEVEQEDASLQLWHEELWVVSTLTHEWSTDCTTAISSITSISTWLY
ncbi:hypothetical protein CYCME_1528 [Cycloclasticus zancles 78-ME]|uniref:Uncharacterized protein n=1 Tax=Cycloclasticus zancles 78-ME TaxID=1198232 RepID=S5TXZ7_9GAMM|nr:hypothetical protein CYCME_1528 [Cycloclasticus zancles 78-ME]